MSARTPGPWVVHKPFKYPYILSVNPETEGDYVVDHQGGPTGLGYVRTDADAEFIVLACNAHDELVAALRQVTNTLAVAVEVSCEVPGFDPEEHVVVKLGRAALAKVSK